MATVVSKSVGNVLGASRAEADTAMLERAFVETADYRALIETQDFNFVVGRRGTGKSALFQKVKSHYRDKTQLFLIPEIPEEHNMIEFQQIINHYKMDYNAGRAFSRLLWKIHILLTLSVQLKDHYKLARPDDYKFFSDINDLDEELLKYHGMERFFYLLKDLMKSSDNVETFIANVARYFYVTRIQAYIKEALSRINRSAIVLYDGLDEGWLPNITAVSVLGGLSRAVADLRDIQSGIHGILFIRDNMFRALAQLDNDFSRHIEGFTIRLHWDSNSLLQLVTKRLRFFLKMENAESDIRVWNRFGYHTLEGRHGFDTCLRYTLYRPRDILVLLNEAYNNASRSGREEIVEDDIELSAKRISHTRLDDLLKEYVSVFPGITSFVSIFQGQPAQVPFRQVVSFLDNTREQTDFDERGDQDFSIFGSGREIFFALYSVGFIGIHDESSGSYIFCHDGSAADLELIPDSRMTAIHPCYWKALDLQESASPQEVMVQINDEYEVKPTGEVQDLRIKRLGQILGELPRLPLGRDGDAEFERWAFTAISILFAGNLSNIELKPNSDAIQRRDIVATNMAASGFWRRILEDYRSRQIIFEVKNYEALSEDDFRQVLSYSSGEYGRFAIIVSRSPSDALNEKERGWIKSMYYEHERLIMILPSIFFSRCLSKLRTIRKHDYTEDSLSKRMDTFVRSYLSLKHEQIFRRKTKKK